MFHMVSTDYKQQLLSKIEDRTAKIGIVGLGYVGLPLAVEFAEAGFTVYGVDVTTSKCEMLNVGHSYIEDIPSSRVTPLAMGKKLQAFDNYDILREVDIISICVPTPLNKTKDPDMTYLIMATDAICRIAHEGMLVVLESTTYPGTTEELMAACLQSNDLRIGENLFVAFSPERIDPGNQKYSLKNTPKVVGGMTENCQDIAAAYYGAICDSVVKVSSPAAAEMVKLLENTFRMVNIGLINEVAIACDRLGINVWEVIDAASSKPFGFMPFYPGPGLGGHCIPVDPHYLSWKLKTLNYTTRFIELASEINTSMPSYVVEKVAHALNDEAKSIRNAKIAVLGVAYKRDISDMRESPALDVIQILMDKGAKVSYNDPHVPELHLHNGQYLYSTPYSEAWLNEADCVVIITDHSDYNWQDVVTHGNVIVDTRNATLSTQNRGSATIYSL